MSAIAYGPVDGEGDFAAVTRLIVHAFAGTAEGVGEWLRASGVENLRVLRDEGGVRACLLRVPMGQYFGGRAVPMLGIAGVAVAPESRGGGLARRLMEESTREAAAEGTALACLYASTQSLYRLAGYEQAGHACRVSIPIATIGIRERGPVVEALTEADAPAIRACYDRFAACFPGTLARTGYIWGRIRKNRGETFEAFGIRDGAGGLSGYVFLTQRRRPETGRHDVGLSDAAFDTPAAGRRLLGFLADFATMGEEVQFQAGPTHPWLMMLPQQRYRVERKEYWMLRVVEVERALLERGYAPGVRAEIGLDVEDELVPKNHGRFTLRVEDGRATVERGGGAARDGVVRVPVRGLAALYSGYMPAEALALGGCLEGEPRALAVAGAVFGGGTPWMGDFF